MIKHLYRMCPLIGSNCICIKCMGHTAHRCARFLIPFRDCCHQAQQIFVRTSFAPTHKPPTCRFRRPEHGVATRMTTTADDNDGTTATRSLSLSNSVHGAEFVRFWCIKGPSRPVCGSFNRSNAPRNDRTSSTQRAPSTEYEKNAAARNGFGNFKNIRITVREPKNQPIRDCDLVNNVCVVHQ